MRGRCRRRLGVAAAALTLAACATPRVEQGVFRVPDLYRVTVPGADWEITSAERNELALRHRDSQAGILTNAECGEGAERADADALAQRLFVGLRDRDTVENGAATVGGAPAVHMIVDAHVGRSEERMRMEAYVIKDARCVYDLVYVAPAALFEAQRPAFRRVVESFAKE